jgi:hypothetical protein
MSDPVNKLAALANQTAPHAAATAVPVVAKTVTQGGNEAASIKGFILQAVRSMEIAAEERDAQKEIFKELEAKHGVKSKVARRVAGFIHRKNKAETEAEHKEAADLYNKIS